MRDTRVSVSDNRSVAQPVPYATTHITTRHGGQKDEQTRLFGLQVTVLMVETLNITRIRTCIASLMPLLSRPKMRVVPVPVRQDNYAYLIIDEPSNKAAAVDPYDVPKVQAAAGRLGVSIIAAITTHHHNDHSGGNKVCSVCLACHHLTATRFLSVLRTPSY